MMDGIRFSELLQYNRDETERWRYWFQQNPAALELPIGPAGTETATVRGMLAHIFFCDLFYAELLSGKGRPFDEYEKIPHNSLEELFALASSADHALAEFLANANPESFTAVTSLGWPPDKPLTGTRRKMLAHTLFHGVRHWAQIATALRQHGHQTGMEHDLLFTTAMK